MTLEKLGREGGFRLGGGEVFRCQACASLSDLPITHYWPEKSKSRFGGGDVECQGCVHLSCTYLNHSSKYSNIDHHFTTVKSTVTQKHVLTFKIVRLLLRFLFYITALIKVWVCPHSLQMAPYGPTQKAWVRTHPKCTQHGTAH